MIGWRRRARHLVRGLSPGLDRGTFHHVHRADRLDNPVSCLRQASGLARQHRAGCALGISRVGFAVAAAVLAVRAPNLDHRHVRGGEEPGEPSPVGTGSFHADGIDGSVGIRPTEQPPVSGPVGLDLDAVESSTVLVDRDRGVRVGMGVDTHDDRGAGSGMVVGS